MARCSSTEERAGQSRFTGTITMSTQTWPPATRAAAKTFTKVSRSSSVTGTSSPGRPGAVDFDPVLLQLGLVPAVAQGQRELAVPRALLPGLEALQVHPLA